MEDILSIRTFSTDKVPEAPRHAIFRTVLIWEAGEGEASEALYDTDAKAFRYGYDEPPILNEIVRWAYPPVLRLTPQE